MIEFRDVKGRVLLLPVYRCHKEVRAVKIAKIDASADGTTDSVLTPTELGYAPIGVSDDFMRRHSPKVGGYFVVYEDGYISYSPGAPFEAGYTRV